MTKNTKHQNSNLTPVGPGATSQGKRAGRPGLRQELSGEIRYRPTQSEHPPRLLPTKAAGQAGEGSTPLPSPAQCKTCWEATDCVDDDGQCLTCAALGWWIEGMASPTTDPTLLAVFSSLSYCPRTGVLTWRERTAQSHPAMTQRARNAWNSRFAGSVAGCLDKSGYLKIGLDGVLHYAHRLAWCFISGSMPVGEIDHINGVRSDNRAANLRVVTQQANQMNRRLPRTNTSGVCGVYFMKGSGKWVAEIYHQTQRFYLGQFDEKDDAISARTQAEKEFGFHENHGKSPPPEPDDMASWGSNKIAEHQMKRRNK